MRHAPSCSPRGRARYTSFNSLQPSCFAMSWTSTKRPQIHRFLEISLRILKYRFIEADICGTGEERNELYVHCRWRRQHFRIPTVDRTSRMKFEPCAPQVHPPLTLLSKYDTCFIQKLVTSLRGRQFRPLFESQSLQLLSAPVTIFTPFFRPQAAPIMHHSSRTSGFFTPTT